MLPVRARIRVVRPLPRASPFAVAVPIRKPVYDPGPLDTATAAQLRSRDPGILQCIADHRNQLGIMRASAPQGQLGCNLSVAPYGDTARVCSRFEGKNIQCITVWIITYTDVF